VSLRKKKKQDNGADSSLLVDTADGTGLANKDAEMEDDVQDIEKKKISKP